MSAIRTLPLAAVAAAVPVALIALAPTPALAHPGHGAELSAGLIGGLVHPWTGLDHLVSLVLAGVWAAMLGGRALLRLPVALLAGMVAGFIAAPSADATLAETLAAFATVSLILVAALRFPVTLPVAASACALFGFGHGLAHGLESTGSDLAFATGMVASSSLLMVLGMAAAQGALRSPALARIALRARR